MKNYKTIISYIFLIIFLYVFYSYVQDNIQLLNEITSIQIGYIGALLIISFFNYAIKAKINKDIYSFSKINLSILESLRIVSRSTAINLSGLANMGAGYKLHYLKKKHGLDIIENLSINIAYAFYLNYFYIIIIFFITLLSDQSGFEKSIYLNLFLMSLVIALFIFLNIINSDKLKRIKISFLKNNLEKLLLGFQYFKNKSTTKRELLVSTIIYILISIFYLHTIMSSVGFNISIYSILVLHCLSSVVNLIKLTPGNIGFLEISLIFFQGLHGITTSQIIIFSTISRIISFVSLLLFFTYDRFLIKTS